MLRVLAPDDWETWRRIRLEREESLHVVAFHGDTAVGMVSGMPGDDVATAWLISMYVTASARGRRVGGALVRAVERWAFELFMTKRPGR